MDYFMVSGLSAEAMSHEPCSKAIRVWSLQKANRLGGHWPGIRVPALFWENAMKTAWCASRRRIRTQCGDGRKCNFSSV